MQNDTLQIIADTLRESIRDIQEARYQAYLTAPELLTNPKADE